MTVPFIPLIEAATAILFYAFSLAYLWILDNPLKAAVMFGSLFVACVALVYVFADALDV